MVNCKAKKTSTHNTCGATLYKCKKCGFIGCLANSSQPCPNEGFKSGRCLRCGSKDKEGLLMPAYRAFFDERGDNIYRLRAFICCESNGNEITGIVAGYSGGGCFEKENFLARVKGKKISYCEIYGKDKVTGKILDADTDFDVPAMGEDIFYELVLWDADSDNMHLNPECSFKPSSKEGDCIEFAGGDTDMPDVILYNLPSLAGLTAGWKK